MNSETNSLTHDRFRQGTAGAGGSPRWSSFSKRLTGQWENHRNACASHPVAQLCFSVCGCWNCWCCCCRCCCYGDCYFSGLCFDKQKNNHTTGVQHHVEDHSQQNLNPRKSWWEKMGKDRNQHGVSSCILCIFHLLPSEAINAMFPIRIYPHLLIYPLFFKVHQSSFLAPHVACCKCQGPSMTGMARYGVLLHALLARNHAWQNIWNVSCEWLEPLDSNKSRNELYQHAKRCQTCPLRSM